MKAGMSLRKIFGAAILVLFLTGCSAAPDRAADTPIGEVDFLGKILFMTRGASTVSGEVVSFVKIYEFTHGDPDPRLLVEMRGLKNEIGQSLISPRRRFVHTDGFFIDLAKGEQISDTLLSTDYGSFSPDDRYLAVGTPWSGLEIIDLETLQSKLLAPGGACKSYDKALCPGCGGKSVCLGIQDITWIDEQTLLLSHHKGYFSNSDELFPDTLSDNETTYLGKGRYILSYQNVDESFIDLQGRFLQGEELRNLFTSKGWPGSDPKPAVQISRAGITWYDEREAILGIDQPHELPESLHPVWGGSRTAHGDMHPGVKFSPSGRYLLRFPSDFVERETGAVTDLQLSDRIRVEKELGLLEARPGSLGLSKEQSIDLDQCIWSLDEQHIVCTYFLSEGYEEGKINLVLLSTSGTPPVFTTVRVTDESSFAFSIYLLTWLPDYGTDIQAWEKHPRAAPAAVVTATVDSGPALVPTSDITQSDQPTQTPPPPPTPTQVSALALDGAPNFIGKLLVNQFGQTSLLQMIDGTLQSSTEFPGRGAAISPDGQSILFNNPERYPPFGAAWKAANNQSFPLMSGEAECFQWSPDGQRFSYISLEPAPGLYVGTLQGQSQLIESIPCLKNQVTFDSSCAHYTCGQWIDASHLLYQSFRGELPPYPGHAPWSALDANTTRLATLGEKVTYEDSPKRWLEVDTCTVGPYVLLQSQNDLFIGPPFQSFREMQLNPARSWRDKCKSQKGCNWQGRAFFVAPGCAFYDGLGAYTSRTIDLYDPQSLQPIFNSVSLLLEAQTYFWGGQWMGDPAEHIAILFETDFKTTYAVTLVDLDTGLALPRIFQSADYFKILGWLP